MLRHAGLVAGIQVFAALSHLKTWMVGHQGVYARLRRAMPPGMTNTGGDNSREKKLSPLLKSSLILHAPCSRRGALMRCLDGGADRRRAWRCALKSGGG